MDGCQMKMNANSLLQNGVWQDIDGGGGVLAGAV
jgi:hypothetical protein